MHAPSLWQTWGKPGHVKPQRTAAEVKNFSPHAGQGVGAHACGQLGCFNLVVFKPSHPVIDLDIKLKKKNTKQQKPVTSAPSYTVFATSRLVFPMHAMTYETKFNLELDFVAPNHLNYFGKLDFGPR